MLGVAGVFNGSLFSDRHGSLVTSSLIRETTENESAIEGYRFNQKEGTYNIVEHACHILQELLFKMRFQGGIHFNDLLS